MKKTLLALALILLAPSSLAGGADTTRPTITIGLADTRDFTSILPFNAARTVPVGKVRFRALVKDGGGNLTNLTMTAGSSVGSAFLSPSAKGYIGLGVDARKWKPGTQVTVTVIASDSAGNRATSTVTVAVQ